MVDTEIRVMVVHASPIVRAGAEAMLSRADDISVVGTADDSASACRRCADLDVDVVVTSPPPANRTPDDDRWIDRLPDSRTVVLTDAIDEALIRALSESGVGACLDFATVDALELAVAVRGVMHGRATFSSGFLADIVRRRNEQTPTALTGRENDVLDLLARGHTNLSIADALGLTPGTVRIYVSNILAKLQAPNRTTAAVVAIQDGLVLPTPHRTGAP
jgi:DNA-binding NarL/FixJ family response regulator